MTDTPDFSGRLLEWWDAHGRHDLPWQHPRTPYRVWISEIMLQQTQVTTVIPYFERFLQKFPDLPTLAAAPLDEVLGLWAGLGYYARARNLHRAANICIDEHGGRLPDSPEALAGLPGIGESTANAIVSQAQDVPAPILDGNVRRVLARYRAVGGWAGKANIQKTLWRIAEELLPSGRGADYTQAIMDLGATVCTRGRPDCDDCPVSKGCLAFERGEVDRYPEPRPRIRVKEQRWSMLLLRRADGAFLLERRPAAGIWGGLWCLPQAEAADSLAQRFGLLGAELQALPRLEHRLTHRLLSIQPYLCHANAAAQAVECAGEESWFRPGEWQRLGLPQPVARLLDQQTKGEKQ